MIDPDDPKDPKDPHDIDGRGIPREPDPIDWAAVHDRLRRGDERLAEVLSPRPETVARTLEERAARFAHRQQAGRKEAKVQLLIFQSGRERIAVDVPAVSEVVRIGHLAPVAGAVPELLGVTTIRGELYGVLDPVQSLARNGGPAGENGNPGWGVVLRHPELRAVFGIEAVVRLETVPASLVAQAHENVLRIGAEIVTLLDVRAVLERLEAEAFSARNHYQSP